MPPNRTKYENLAILKTHSRRNLMHLASRFHRDLHVPFSGGNKQDQVKVCPAELMVYLKHKRLALLPDEMAQCCIIKVIVGWIKQVSKGTAQS